MLHEAAGLVLLAGGATIAATAQIKLNPHSLTEMQVRTRDALINAGQDKGVLQLEQ